MSLHLLAPRMLLDPIIHSLCFLPREKQINTLYLSKSFVQRVGTEYYCLLIDEQAISDLLKSRTITRLEVGGLCGKGLNDRGISGSIAEVIAAQGTHLTSLDLLFGDYPPESILKIVEECIHLKVLWATFLATNVSKLHARIQEKRPTLKFNLSSHTT